MPEQLAPLVLADIPERNRLRELTAALEERRDRIGELDLEIEQLRDELVAFETAYEARLAIEQFELQRIERLVKHFDRWMDLLRDKPKRIVEQMQRVDEKRARELSEAKREREEIEEPPEPKAAPDEQLKSAYRKLARKYHPDLARTEDERVAFGDLMAKINALYKAGDLDRLLALAEKQKGGEIDDPEVPLLEQVAQLEERLRWFEVVLGNLQEERAALEGSAACELMRNVLQAEAAGRDLVAEIQGELRGRADRAYEQVRKAALALEASVARWKSEQQKKLEVVPKKSARALERAFDPFGDKKLVRLGLEELATLKVSKAARARAEALEVLGEEQPAVLRLVLLTYVSELSPYPLPGLERYEDLRIRFNHLAASDAAPESLEHALVAADELVEFGVRKASERMAHMGLRFRSSEVRDAAPLLLKSLAIRREQKRVLGVLGERAACKRCSEEVFAVPLFKTHGLDDLRANVCPQCGETLSSYWMPKGKDVQAVLNPAFLDFELVTEWSFQLSRGTVGMQLLPLQVSELTVEDLIARLHADIFKRYELELEPAQITLLQKKTRVAPSTPLDDLDNRKFSVRFTDAAIGEAEALEMLRHRVRNRFKR